MSHSLFVIQHTATQGHTAITSSGFLTKISPAAVWAKTPVFVKCIYSYSLWRLIQQIIDSNVRSYANELCVARLCKRLGFDPRGTHILIKYLACKSLWIEYSTTKCTNVRTSQATCRLYDREYGLSDQRQAVGFIKVTGFARELHKMKRQNARSFTVLPWHEFSWS